MIPGIVWRVVEIAWPLVAGFAGAWAYAKFFYKKERRLFKNIRRPICLFATSDTDLKREHKILKRAGFFNVGNISDDISEADFIRDKENRLIIIGYSPGNANFKAIYDAAKNANTPVVVYSGPNRILPDDMQYIQGYSFHSIANTPLRLISDVFALMSTYPEDK
jgi:hypothetical protein